MNRSKQFINKKLAKKIHKEVRLAQSAYPLKEERYYSDAITPSTLLKRYPRRKAKKIKEQITSLKADIKSIKAKRTAHHAKRTTPGEKRTRKVSTEHIHPQSKRQVKKLVQQERVRRRQARIKGNKIQYT